MGCCELPRDIISEARAGATPAVAPRRTVLKGAAAIAGLLAAAASGGRAGAQARPVKLAFCSQLLCVVPYEVARAGGHFAREGLEVELVYTRGGNAAMQALVGGAVDYAATSLEVAIQAFAQGADIRRFATTGRLPLFALATAPRVADEVVELKDLEGRTVGISALGNADHALALYLLQRAGADPTRVEFATLGPNLLEALRQGQIDAGMVQEPALSLLQDAGGRVLVNAMEADDARRYLGGDYEFMGVAVRAAEVESRRAEMAALARALASALRAMRTTSAGELIAALPAELIAGGDTAVLEAALARYKDSLYPTETVIDLDASRRVAETLRVAGLLAADVDPTPLFDTSIAGG
jgi:NitT/TauT family transport system substrate-binding protein